MTTVGLRAGTASVSAASSLTDTSSLVLTVEIVTVR
jgi:hypothetical protein